jgi:hypothetical protein
MQAVTLRAPAESIAQPNDIDPARAIDERGTRVHKPRASIEHTVQLCDSIPIRRSCICIKMKPKRIDQFLSVHCRVQTTVGLMHVLSINETETEQE